MSLADPQSVTLAAPLPVGAVSLPRTNFPGPQSTQYTSADQSIKLTAGHQVKQRARRTLRYDYSKIAANPFDSGKNLSYSMSFYMVFDVPLLGFTNSEIFAVYTAAKGNFTATSDANVTKLIAGES